MTFRDITIDDKLLFDEYVKTSKNVGTESCFTDIFAWRKVYKIEIAFEENFVFIRGIRKKDNKDIRFYYRPFGKGKFKEAVEKIMACCESEGVEFLIYGVDESCKGIFQKYFPHKLNYRLSRSTFDYIYLQSNLASLKGKALHSKKNHLNKFRKTYPDYKVEEITRENIDECLKMNENWCLENNIELPKPPCCSGEFCALLDTFKYYERLGCKGILIRVGGQVIAFTLGTERNKDVFVTHFEKALYSYEGSFACINYEFANYLNTYKYINREDDMGRDGLRQAKMSYRPHILYMKYHVSKRN